MLHVFYFIICAMPLRAALRLCRIFCDISINYNSFISQKLMNWTHSHDKIEKLLCFLAIEWLMHIGTAIKINWQNLLMPELSPIGPNNSFIFTMARRAKTTEWVDNLSIITFQYTKSLKRHVFTYTLAWRHLYYGVDLACSWGWRVSSLKNHLKQAHYSKSKQCQQRQQSDVNYVYNIVDYSIISYTHKMVWISIYLR